MIICFIQKNPGRSGVFKYDLPIQENFIWRDQTGSGNIWYWLQCILKI